MAQTRTPAWLDPILRAINAGFDRGLGRLLRRRFLQLSHTGRRSGRTYRAVLEAVHYDAETGEVVVISGERGRDADWFRNVLAGGPVAVSFGRGPRPAAYRLVGEDEAVQLLEDYERRYGLLRPVLLKVLSFYGRFDYRGTDVDRHRLAEAIPLVAFRPARR